VLSPLDLSGADLLLPSEAGPLWAIFVGIGILGVGPGAAIGAMLLRARRLARAQAHEHEWLVEGAQVPLAPGESRVVAGQVEVDGTDPVAVEVEVEQRVSNHRNKNGAWHIWTETRRSVRVAPFYLVRPDGDSIYVEPDEDARVVDLLATKYPLDAPQHRVRSADVRRGEEYFVYGDVARGPHARALEGYRGGLGWIVRAPRRGRMLLATEAIRDRYEARVAFLRAGGVLLALAFLLLHALFTAPFFVASFFGTHTTALVTATDTYVTTSKNTHTTHYTLTARTSDGFTLEQEVPRDVYNVAHGRDVVSVPLIRCGNSTWASFLGTEAYVFWGWLVFGVVGTGVSWLLLSLAYGRRYAWYDRAKLVERAEGLWVETRPTAPIDPAAS
jgi:hypothetical protein